MNQESRKQSLRPAGRHRARAIRGLVMAGIIAAFTSGCGSDTFTSAENPSLSINVRNGTWETVNISFPWVFGPDSCLTKPDTTIVDSLVYCTYNPVQVGDNLPVFLRCDELFYDAQTGVATFDCVSTVDLSPCVIVQHQQGTAVVNDTTYTLNGVSWVFLESTIDDQLDFCRELYGDFADSCLTQFVETGTWISAETEGTPCLPDPTSARSIPFVELFGRTATRALRLPE